jgi:hypothetical protein
MSCIEIGEKIDSMIEINVEINFDFKSLKK